MVGAITTWDILQHPVITIRCFGWGVFFRALLAGQGQTFLSLLPKPKAERVSPASPRLLDLIHRCINLEYRAKRLYTVFSKTFADWPLASTFFDTLAQQEQDHADLLVLCAMTARRTGSDDTYYNPWQEYLPQLEQHLQEVEDSLHEVGSLEDALHLVIQIESGEVNRVFESVLASSNSEFAKRLRSFGRAIQLHMAFIGHWLPELAPRLVLSSPELETLFPKR